jgi:endonuclease III
MHDGPHAKIWRAPVVQRRRIVNRVCAALEKTFGSPRLGNPKDPVDDLTYLMLSNRTQAKTAQEVYSALKLLRHTWNEVAALPTRSIARVIRPAGFADIRSAQIRGALRKIARRFGKCSLDELRRWSEEDAHQFLVSLPGVSDKVAKCVMMYTLGFEVLPVDVHVFRVSTRLGWTSRCRASECHADLETLVPPKLRYGFHVNCIALGRQFCQSSEPLCNACPISKLCIYSRQRTHEPIFPA